MVSRDQQRPSGLLGFTIKSARGWMPTAYAAEKYIFKGHNDDDVKACIGRCVSVACAKANFIAEVELKASVHRFRDMNTTPVVGARPAKAARA
jgi:hypothetical protein